MTDSTGPAAVTERWVSIGTRVGRDGTRCAAWLPGWSPEDGPPAKDAALLYGERTGRYVTGGVYEVKVEHLGDGRVSLYVSPGPRYTGRRYGRDDGELAGELALEWDAASQAAEAKLAVIARERRDKDGSPLDDALKALAPAVAGCRSRTDLEALLIIVSRRLTEQYEEKRWAGKMTTAKAASRKAGYKQGRADAAREAKHAKAGKDGGKS